MENVSLHYGYIYRVNKRVVVAPTIDDAIGLYRVNSAVEDEVIEEVKLLDKEQALVFIRED